MNAVFIISITNLYWIRICSKFILARFVVCTYMCRNKSRIYPEHVAWIEFIMNNKLNDKLRCFWFWHLLYFISRTEVCCMHDNFVCKYKCRFIYTTTTITSHFHVISLSSCVNIYGKLICPSFPVLSLLLHTHQGLRFYLNLAMMRWLSRCILPYNSSSSHHFGIA